MPPKQATLGKFFGQPGASKPAPAQQSKLSFTATAPKKDNEKDDDGAFDRNIKTDTKARHQATRPKPGAQATAEPRGRTDAADQKKRPHSALSPKHKVKQRPAHIRKEQSDDSGEESGAPMSKRARKSRRRILEDEDVSDTAMPDAGPMKRSESRSRGRAVFSPSRARGDKSDTAISDSEAVICSQSASGRRETFTMTSQKANKGKPRNDNTMSEAKQMNRPRSASPERSAFKRPPHVAHGKTKRDGEESDAAMSDAKLRHRSESASPERKAFMKPAHATHGKSRRDGKASDAVMSDAKPRHRSKSASPERKAFMKPQATHGKVKRGGKESDAAMSDAKSGHRSKSASPERKAFKKSPHATHGKAKRDGEECDAAMSNAKPRSRSKSPSRNRDRSRKYSPASLRERKRDEATSDISRSDLVTHSKPGKRVNQKVEDSKRTSPARPNANKEEEKSDTARSDAERAKRPKSRSGKKQKSKKSSHAPPSPTQDSRRELVEKNKEEAEDEQAASESASGLSETEDDVKPDVAKKAREEVQSKFKAKVKDAYPDWKAGQAVPYAALCKTFSLIEMTPKRLVIIEHCALFLRQVLRLSPDDFLSTVLLMTNRLAPDYAGIELGIGESLIMKAIGESTGRSVQVIKQDHREIGDLGLVAVKSRSTQPTMFKPKALTIQGVHQGLMAIATVTGNGAQGRKVDLIKKLLSAADAQSAGKVDISKDKGGPSEAKFLVRFLEGKLRLGLAERTVLVAIAHAAICHEADGKGRVPSTTEMAQAESVLKTVYSELPSWNVIIPAMLEHGILKLRERCKLRPGVPLKPMLAKPTKAITEVLDRFENQTFTCEYKYDGERAQIHYVHKDHTAEYMTGLGAGDKPRAAKQAATGIASVFSRNSEDLSQKYPDILAKLHTWVKDDTKSFVLDCESVAWDMVEKKVLPFQQLMTRKKKDVKVADVKVKVCVFAFDLLFLNGEALVEKSLRQRRDLLLKSFEPVEGEFAFATHMDGQELGEIQTFLDDSVKASCEGLMVKMLDGVESGYEPSKRSRNWLKIKKDYLSGIGDSLDLVVVGAYHGQGKRTSVYGAFLLACYNAATESYQTICKIGTGFSEQMLEDIHKSLSKIVIDRPKPFYSHSAGGQHQPDVWFEARYVWEVKTADLTLSPRYKAACKEGVDPSGEKGISLRFPRFIQVREDKKPDEATASRQVADMYRRQEIVAKTKGPAVDDDFEY